MLIRETESKGLPNIILNIIIVKLFEDLYNEPQKDSKLIDSG